MTRILGWCRSWPLVLVFMIAACAAPREAPKPIEAPVYPPPPEEPRYFYDRTIFSSGDVIEDTSGDQFRRFATGESALGRGLDKPFGVVAANGRIFVGDTVARRVFVFDFPRKSFSELGVEGMGRLAKPLGMAVDQVGHLYVCDGGAKRVNVYGFDGAYIMSIGGAETFERPSSVAASADGSRIYVLDTGGVRSEEHRVRVFDATGKHVFDIGRRGAADGEFNLPLDVTVGPDGRVYVVDAGNFRVQVFSADGQFLMKFGNAGRRPGQFSHPKGIAVDEEGKIFVADTGFANFQIFDRQGQILMFIGTRSERGGPGEFLLPAGISVDVDGRIYVVDQFFRKVDVFRPASLPAGAPVGMPRQIAPEESVPPA